MIRKTKTFIKRLTKTRLYERTYIFIDKLLDYKILKKRFFNLYGYPLNLKEPQYFQEKINWKKLYDRNPLLPITTDKYMVREYIKQRLGKELSSEILVPLFYVTSRPETIPFDELPDNYIVKANHGCKMNIIVEKRNRSKAEIISKCNHWLKKTYGIKNHEWAYWNIQKKIIVEELLIDEDGKIPKDYKFFVFHGICKKIMVFSNRYTNRSNSAYDRDWNYISNPNKKPPIQLISKPAAYDKMLFIAEELGKDFDFVRVDLYTTKGKVYFGELTHYPLSGLTKKSSLSDDIELGKHWNIPS
jgi:hypothetical protein